MDRHLAELVWKGISEANPWWRTGQVPPEWAFRFRREAFPTIYGAVRGLEAGRGVVLLGPRRVGKTVLLHQVAADLLREGIPREEVCLLTLDDVALRGRDLGELLELIESRRPLEQGRRRFLLLDEIQHSSEWSGWLKRIADRRAPYVFLATGSSATALRRGGEDAGVGRWREMTLFPWSFREHVKLRGLSTWTFDFYDQVVFPAEQTQLNGGDYWDAFFTRLGTLGPAPEGETARLETALVDYFIRGGFPEVALSPDLPEARRRLRQDILDRSLGRDISDVLGVDTRLLERMFLRVCLAPGGLWNEVEVSRDLGVSRPTVARYLHVLERAFLVFRLPNLASPVKGQPKVYLVAPAFRQALLGIDEDTMRHPDQWGPVAENAVMSLEVGSNPAATQIGFWRKGDECDLVAVHEGAASLYLEIKRGGQRGERGLRRAAEELGHAGVGAILGHDAGLTLTVLRDGPLRSLLHQPVAAWLYARRVSHGGTLRMDV